MPNSCHARFADNRVDPGLGPKAVPGGAAARPPGARGGEHWPSETGMKYMTDGFKKKAIIKGEDFGTYPLK